MANLDFYASPDDMRDLLQFLFAETDIVIYELSSQADTAPQHFSSITELESHHRLGAHPALHFQLWSPSMMARPVIRRIQLTGIKAHSFRYAVEGAGLMQLYLDGREKGVVHHSHFGHWNEAGARRRSMHSADDCDWSALNRLSGRIQRVISRRLAVARLHSRPVLRGTYAGMTAGARLRFNAATHSVDSPDLKLLRPPDGRARSRSTPEPLS